MIMGSTPQRPCATPCLSFRFEEMAKVEVQVEVEVALEERIHGTDKD